MKVSLKPTNNKSIMSKRNDFLVEDLKTQIALGDVAIFVGAGVSVSATNNDTYANWRGLLENGVERCESVVSGLPIRWGERVREELHSDDMDDLLSAAQKIETKLKRTGGEFGRWLEETIGTLKVLNSDVVDALHALRSPILTTNYDNILEQASGKQGFTWRQKNQVEQVLQGGKQGIVHVHGYYEQPDTVVLGIRSYEDVIRDEFIQTMLKSLRSLRTLLFVGYGDGLDDPNFGPLFEWSSRVFDKSHYRHFILSRDADQQRLQAKFNPDSRIFVCSYGENYSQLAPFLKTLGEKPRAPGPGTVTHDPSTNRGVGKLLGKTAEAKSKVVDLQLSEYYKSLRESHGFIRFVEMPNTEEMSDVRIEELFVEPQLSQQEIHPDTPEGAWPERIRVADALKDHKKLVLLGDPGSGKSTLISSLTYQLCRSDSAKVAEEPGVKNQSVPIPMILRELKLRADLTWEGLLNAFLLHRTGKLFGSRDKIEAILRTGNALIMLDGLDEIGNLVIRRKLRDAVHAGMSQYPNAQWVLTSRIVGYDEVPFHYSSIEEMAQDKPDEESRLFKVKQADVFFVSPFNNTEIRQFAGNWFKQHETESSLVDEKANGLIEAISFNDGTQRLARIPYLLTLIAIIYRKTAKLPHGRSDLYDRIAAGYLESIDVRRNLDQLPYSLPQKMRWLAEIGYQMQLRRSKAKSQSSKQREILADSSNIQKLA